jgi:arginyl-tRNA synthetase
MNILFVRDELKRQISKFFDIEYKQLIENINISIPEMEFGDLSTNICLAESKSLKVSPVELADKLKAFLEGAKLPYLKSVEIKGPGFLNFWIGKFEQNFIQKLFSKTRTIQSKYTGAKVLVEHSSPNLFKPLNIGHLMSNFTGEFLVRILREAGAEVKVISFPSDISIGIAKAIYIIKEDGGLEQEIFESSDEAELVEYLGQTYVRGVEMYKKWKRKERKRI